MVGRNSFSLSVVLMADRWGARCAFLGLSAVVADIRHTCLACAIREAYAARVAVAIITDSVEIEDEPAPRASPYTDV